MKLIVIIIMQCKVFSQSKIMFFGEFWPPNIIFIIETPKRPYLTWKHAFWAINGRDRSSGVTGIQKKDRTKSNGKCPPYADPLPVVPHQPKFACGVVSWISFLVSSFIKIGWKMWELWGGRNFGLPIDLAHRLYNSLLLRHKPWNKKV